MLTIHVKIFQNFMIKMVQALTNSLRFFNSGTNLCSLSESPCIDYAAMVIKCILKGNNT